MTLPPAPTTGSLDLKEGPVLLVLALKCQIYVSFTLPALKYKQRNNSKETQEASGTEKRRFYCRLPRNHHQESHLQGNPDSGSTGSFSHSSFISQVNLLPLGWWFSNRVGEEGG